MWPAIVSLSETRRSAVRSAVGRLAILSPCTQKSLRTLNRSRFLLAALLTLKTNWFDTLTVKLMINNDVILFSATNEETPYEQLLHCCSFSCLKWRINIGFFYIYCSGAAAQEIVKLITHQFVPFNNTYIYNGITGCSTTLCL